MAETINKFMDLEGLKHFVAKLYARGFKGMGLSQENFTAELKAKYDALAAASSVEDLTALFERVSAVEALIESDKDGAINKFNEIVKFLEGVEDTQSLKPIIADVAANKARLANLTNVDNTSDANKPISTATKAALDKKVDAVAGKGLSTNDYTTAEKNLVATISDKLNASDMVALTDAEIDAIVAAAE